MNPYLKCLMGPPAMASPSVGYPDGSSAPALPIDYRQIITLTPEGGRLVFALVSSPYGCLAIQRGRVLTQLPKYLAATDLSYTWDSVPAQATISGNSGPYYVLPFNEVVASSAAPSANPFGPYSATRYRGIMYTADVSFTGSSLENQGVVRVYKTNVGSTVLTQANVNTVACRRVEYTSLLSGLGAATGTVAGAARHSMQLRSVAAHPEYIPVEENFISTNIVALGRDSSNNLTEFVWTGLDSNVPVTVVEYSGLAGTSSITIELRSCVEQVVAPGAMSGLAKPSPPADMSVWQKAANFARSLPAAKILGNAAAGYMSGGAVGAVTGALAALTV